MAEDRIAEILGEWRDRRDSGEDVDPEEIILSHPELAEALRMRFRAIAALDERPRVIGEYRIVREIGRGGMGIVYEAEQVSMQRKVALKVLYPAVTSVPQAVKRFQQEARAAGRLKHTNIVAVHQLGHDDGVWYAAMELVEGRPLNDVIADMAAVRKKPRESRLARRTLGISTRSGLTGTDTGTRAYYVRVAEMFADVAAALQVAHDHGVVHRDLKPGNLLLDVEGNLKLLDFGLARLEGAAAMTMTGDILGTPYYMSPEQITGRHGDLDHRTDVYSLGASLYETLALQPPFKGETLQAVTRRILEQDPPPLRRHDAGVPRDLETIVAKALEKEPGRRYRTAGDMAADLRRFAQGGAIRARRIGPLGVAWRRIKRHKTRSALGAALLVALAGAVVFFVRAERGEEQRAAQERQRVAAEYDMLCVRAHEAVAVTFYESQMRGAGDRARDLFTRAIALAPDRPEAYFGRGLLEGTLDERLADIDAAAARGLSPRTVHLARAHLLSLAGRPDEALEEEQRARAHERGAPADAFFEARILVRRGHLQQAIELFTEAIDASPRSSSVRFRAQRSRAFARELVGDYEGAIADLAAVEEAADEPVRIKAMIASLWRKLPGDAERLFEQALAECRARGTEQAWHALCEGCRWREETAWLGRATEEALRSHPRSAPLLIARADFLEDSGRLESALRTCERALSLDDTEAWAHALRGKILSRLGRHLEAVTAYEQALERKEAPELWSNLGIAYEEFGRQEAARDAFERALASGPSNWNVLCNVAAFYMNSEPERALELARQAVNLEPLRCEGYLKLGAALERHGRHAEALAASRRAVGLAPEHAEARNHLATYLFRRGDLDEALVEADRAAELGWSKAQWTRGDVFKALGRLDEAVDAFDQATRDTPDEPQPHAAKAWTLYELGRHAEAVKAADAAIRLHAWPHTVKPPDWAHTVRSAALLELGRKADALRAANDARKVNPASTEALHRKALALVELGRARDAVAVYDQALKEEPDSQLFWRNKALIHRNQLGEMDEAIRAMTRSLKIGLAREPKNPVLHTTLGTVFVDAGAPDKALACYERAIKAQPSHANAHYNKGNLLLSLERVDDAVAAYEEALRHEEKHAGACWNAHVAHRQAGRSERALEMLIRFMTLVPKEPMGPLATADVLCETGRIKEARAVLEKALALGDPRIFERLARLELDTDPARAVALAREAVKRNPQAPLVLGIALVRNGEWQEGLRVIEETMRLTNGGGAEAWLFAAIALWHLDEKDKARRLHAKAAAWIDANAPDNAEAARMRAEVAQLVGAG